MLFFPSHNAVNANPVMCENVKSIEVVLQLTDNEYSEYVGSLANHEDAYWLLDELDDDLLKIVEQRPEDVERICRLNSMAFEQLPEIDMRLRLLGYNFNTRLIAAILRKSVTDAKAIYLAGIEFCRTNKHYEVGKSIAQNVFRLWTLAPIPDDEALFFLMKAKEFYEELGKHEDCVVVLCAAAMRFADAAAFQSAYRALADAQQIALGHKLYRLHVRTLETQATVALMEGDLPYAETEFDRCIELYNEIGEPPAFWLKANAALVKMRQNKYPAARDLYLDLIKNYSATEFTAEHRQAKINLLVCYRELNDSAAIQDLSNQVESDLEILELEQRIEAHLVLAKTYFHIKDFPTACNHLKNACFGIQIEIDQFYRLHYRRGVRERYMARIKCMLANLEPTGQCGEILPALILCCSNALLDWLSTLEWHDRIQQSAEIPIETKEELSKNIEELIQFGTPFLYGFREKYDDPFEFAGANAAKSMGQQVAKAADYSRPWREFNDLATRIREVHELPSPLEDASLQQSLNKIEKLLAQNSSFLFSFVCAEGWVFLFVMGNQFYKSVLDSNHAQQFFLALHEYQRGGIDRGTFKARLSDLQLSLSPVMSKIIKLIEDNSISELVFVSDQITEGIPVLPSLFSSDVLRSRIMTSGFVFRSCPILKEGHDPSFVDGSCVYISNSADDLTLANAEKNLVRNAFGNEKFAEIDLLFENADFSTDPIKSANALHFTSHSVSATAFTDTNFVSTSTDITKKGLWLESAQREAHKLNLSLVVLNGCNTGSTMSWNYFKKFLTHEKVGLSSIFLLNRRCFVAATHWNMPDVMGYAFTSLFFKRLASQPSPIRAWNMVIVELYEMTPELTIKLFEEIPNEVERTKRIAALKQSKTKLPFRDIFYLGVFQQSSLLKA